MSCISRILSGGRFKVMMGVGVAGYLVGASGPLRQVNFEPSAWE